MPWVNELHNILSTNISFPVFSFEFMLRRSMSQNTIFLSLDPDENCILWWGFQETTFTASLWPTKLWICIKKMVTFLLRLRISQKQTSPSSPPDSSKWGLFLLKSIEYTSPVWAFLVRTGPDVSLYLMSQLDRISSTYIFFNPVEHYWICFNRNLTILHLQLHHLLSMIKFTFQD